MRFELVARSGREVGRTITLSTGQTVTFGRLKNCDVQVDDESVSRRHCTLHAREDRIVVADLQSANGTFVNDKRVATAELKPLDKMRIGSTVFEFVLETGVVSSPDATATASFKLTADDRGHTLIRKSVDPNKLDFLTEVFKKQDRGAVVESAQRYLSTLHRVSDLLSRASGVEALFDSILSIILDVTGGERAAILLAEQAGTIDSTTEVNAVAVRTSAGATSVGDMVLSRTVVRDVLEHGLSTFSHDALADSRYGSGESIVRQKIRSVMCAPMRTTDRILGVLYVDSSTTHAFSEAELELLAAIGNQAGVALHRARLLAEVERLFIDVMRAIAAIIDAKDGYTHRHSERVAQFSVRLAHQLGLSTDERAVVELSALLHDVGKIGVPDAILNKPGKLTDEEFAEMKRHPAHGAAILSNIQSQKVLQLLPGVKYHHEKWDGTGYPDGLKGEDIPLLGRILAVADFLDALSSDRAYRSATPIAEVVDIVRELAGRAFDPVVVDALVTLHDRGELALPVSPGPTLR
jgi:HD-GYP domain-containing protein (c-di-GMP phosphodiesterase class II)